MLDRGLAIANKRDISFSESRANYHRLNLSQIAAAESFENSTMLLYSRKIIRHISLLLERAITLFILPRKRDANFPKRI